MALPKLPQYSTPPSVPRTGSSSSGESRQGGGCFNILLMFCLAWAVIALFTKKKEPSPVPEENLPQTVQIQPKGDEYLAAIAETLSPDLREEAQRKIGPQFVTLGSLDPNSPYRMLVTISNRGAAVTRVEMNEKGFRDCADASGYLGQIVADETIAANEILSGLPGLGIQTVGAGTPAAAAGLKPGDRIVSIDLSETESAGGVVEIAAFEDLRDALLKTKPDELVKLGILRADTVSAAEGDVLEAESVAVTLGEAPLQVIRPMGVIANYGDYVNMVGLQGVSRDSSNDAYDVFSEKEFRRRPNTDASSFLMTLATYDDKETLPWPVYREGDRKTTVGRNSILDNELPFYAFTEDGTLIPSAEAGMRAGDWEYVADESNESTAVFRKVLPGHRLEARKVFSLSSLESADTENKKRGGRDFGLNLTVELRNLDTEKHTVSYFLDGPTSLPVEGLWYSMGRKTGPGWGTYGLHDVILKLGGNNFSVFKCTDIALEKKENSRPSDPVSIDFIGVDSQYFEATMIPEARDGQTPLFEYLPLRVGARLAGKETFTNTSFRLKSGEKELAPAGQNGDTASESYTVFIGPKRPADLKSYGLGETLVYGWFWFVSKPLAWILEFFRHYMVFNYGLAIILLTILVRLCMFPISIKMVASSLRMQKLQPQISALQAKYKDDANALMKAQRELWKKNKVNPLGSCLPMFLQIPVFCGLYKVLNLDVNLYGAPLISEKVRWCSNLAAPDMLLNWSDFWNSHGWTSFNLGMGIFSLGPYLNLLPLLTVALFLVQQAILSPPVTGRTPEEIQQQKMMRFMMKVMMVMMGFMFFKVPCGLCIYFITSALWGILERRFLPKRDQEIVTDDGTAVIDVTPAPASDAEKLGKPHNARRNRRTNTSAEPEKKGWRAKWQEILEKTKEQQKLAKAELEKRKKAADRQNYNKKNKKRK
ncbi:MAG: YidC/Oxa1 family insertase periplasmic-domain containing protein [Thermoguttaceae bacterium]|nr:YidC/Oxa1 family insertase periplasmic-domain containing protein [Thermoguttaceae bacterium]